jgi:hypothetical protein
MKLLLFVTWGSSRGRERKAVKVRISFSTTPPQLTAGATLISLR